MFSIFPKLFQSIIQNCFDIKFTDYFLHWRRSIYYNGFDIRIFKYRTPVFEFFSAIKYFIGKFRLN